MTDEERVAAFRERNGLDALIDVHTHFMPPRLMAAVQAYFDSGGPLIGRPWPIAYRQAEDARVAALEGLERAGLGPHWLRAVCHGNAARLFGL